MRKATISAALACSLLLSASMAAGQPNDGNYWRTLDAQSKGAYVLGFRDAMASCPAFATPKLNSGSTVANAQCKVLLGTNDNKAIGLVLKVTQGQLRDALDQLYEDATNRLLLISRALGVIFMRLTGSSEQEIGEVLEFERAMAAGTVTPPQ